MSAVVVGVSTTAENTLAVDWASREAVRRGLALHLVHAWDIPVDVCVDLDPDFLPDPCIAVTARAVCGDAATVLLARDCQLLVLGAPADNRRTSALIRACLRHATCPVAVIPSTPPASTGRIVVGLHDCPASRQALRWATDEARRRLDHLTVVHAWQLHPTHTSDLLRPARAIVAQRAAVDSRLRTWVHATVGDLDSELDGELVTTRGAPLDTLLEAGIRADLLVIGHHPRSGLSRLLTATIATDLATLAPCPLVVIPNHPHGPVTRVGQM